MVQFKCIRCGHIAPAEDKYVCHCGGLYEVHHEYGDISLDQIDGKLSDIGSAWSSGVWRYKELIHPEIDPKHIVSRPEGNTNLYKRSRVSEYAGIEAFYLQPQGENPSGSFKDRGMTVGVSVAVQDGAKKVACASTGNTSASMAAYAAQAGLQGIVFIPEGMIAYGKLAQALAYGSKVIQVKGNFDDAMGLIRNGAKQLGFYILNSLNPWRIEGQKSIIFEMLQQRKWSPPDWIVVPAGNLGNTSAFGKALRELKQLGLIDKMPKIAAIQAEGANPFYKLWNSVDKKLESMKPETIATAIKIGNPVSWEKALRSIRETNGVVEQVSDNEILNAKAIIDASGIGCEPASAASLAGAKKLRDMGVITEGEKVVGILTGNLLKDPETTFQYHIESIEGIEAMYSNRPVQVEADLDNIQAVLSQANQRAQGQEVKHRGN
jgi:threonine synthase